jgi:hypothetical protein
MQNLDNLLNSVIDEASFLAFASALAEDRIESREKEKINPSSPYGSAANGWQNTTIEDFLESAVAWGEASNLGATQALSPTNPWQRFATFLYCGKIYE